MTVICVDDLYLDKHIEMWDMSTRLAIDLSHVHFPVASCCQPKPKSRRDIDEWSILPSKTDGQELVQSATSFIMRFMTEKLSAFHHLAAQCPSLKPYKEPEKTAVWPLEIVDANEGTKDGTITVLEKFVKDFEKRDLKAVVRNCYSYGLTTLTMVYCRQWWVINSHARILEGLDEYASQKEKNRTDFSG